jgi:hypothetical protein
MYCKEVNPVGLWPSRRQWKSWSLPSKLTAIGTLLGVISLGLYAVEKSFHVIALITERAHQEPDWIGSNSQIPLSEPTKYKTLHDLFLSDFQKTRMLAKYDLTKNNQVVYTVEYIIWSDFDTKSLFFSVFLPKSDAYTFKACRFLATKYRAILNGNLQTLMKGIINLSPPGSTAETWADLSFSGRVYIYHETPLFPARIETLMEAYKKEGLYPQFRGPDYLVMRHSPLYKQ